MFIYLYIYTPHAIIPFSFQRKKKSRAHISEAQSRAKRTHHNRLMQMHEPKST